MDPDAVSAEPSRADTRPAQQGPPPPPAPTGEPLGALELELRFSRVVGELLDSQRATADARAALAALESSKVMRYSRFARRLYGAVRRLVPTPAPAVPTPAAFAPNDEVYRRWIQEFDTVDETRWRLLDRRLAALSVRPLVSVVMPVFNAPEAYLRGAIESVLAQRYGDWELCVVDDASTAPHVARVLAEYAARDERVRVMRREVNGHISAASNSGVEMAGGEWVVLLDHDDVLAEHALALAILAASGRPDVGLLYSDEDKIDDRGQRSMPFFKPDFDPVLLLAQNYICHMTMIRSALVRQVGGFREGLEGSQDWDLVLRVSELLGADRIVHVPHVLYHWRIHPASTAGAADAKPYALRAGERAVRDHLDRAGRPAEILVNEPASLLRARWALPRPVPTVSIVIPTRDGRYLGRCLKSVFACSAYPDLEVVVVDNGSTCEETFEIFGQYAATVRVVRDDRPFNYSALNNGALEHCRGEVVCLLNDDCEVLGQGWLEEMVSQLSQDGVGVVGAKLLYPDTRVQHAGVVLGMGGVAAHPHELADRLDYGYFGWLQTVRSLSAVSAACMVVRRSVYEELGGLDEVNLGVAYNDVDFCLRARERGWRVIWTPHAVLLHHASVSRGNDLETRPQAFWQEVDYMERRWGHLLRADPAYNPNLTLTAVDFAPAFPPRLPWWAPD